MANKVVDSINMYSVSVVLSFYPVFANLQ